MAAYESATPQTPAFADQTNQPEPEPPDPEQAAPATGILLTRNQEGLVLSEDTERNDTKGTTLEFTNGTTIQVARQNLQAPEIAQIGDLAAQAVQIEFLKRDFSSLVARTAFVRKSIASVGGKTKKTEYLMGRMGLSNDNLTHAYLSLIAEFVPVLEELIKLGVREIFCNSSSSVKIGIHPRAKLDSINLEWKEILW